MKKIIAIVATLLALLIMSGCGAIKLAPEKQSLIDSKTQMYTQVSMWNDRNRIKGTNYSVGLHIPVNSKVTILSVSAKAIVFKYNEQKMTYYTIPKHTGLQSEKLIDRLFSKTPVDLSKYSKSIQDNILMGKVVKGMSKNAVLLARGYPPLHITTSTTSDSWRYMRNRWISALITFKDDKVSEIKGTVS